MRSLNIRVGEASARAEAVADSKASYKELKSDFARSIDSVG
jgi:hypothetical protein